jgi:hypothetical protein
MHCVISAVATVTGGVQLTTDNTIQIEGQERPAAVATFIARFYA